MWPGVACGVVPQRPGYDQQAKVQGHWQQQEIPAKTAVLRAQRTQQLLAEGLERFEAIARVREEAKAQPWTLLNK